MICGTSSHDGRWPTRHRVAGWRHPWGGRSAVHSAVLLLPAFLLAASAASGGQAGGGTAAIRGRVTAADTGLPLRHARLEFVSGPSAMTDDSGFYEINGLAAGTYMVIAWPPRNKAMYLSARRLASGEQAWITVAEGQTVEGADFALPRGGAISGRVLDDFGQPIAGMSVAVLEHRLRRLLPAGRGGLSDDEGRFRVYGLPPGQYYVRANGASASWSEEAGPNGETHLRTFYPNTTSASHAVPVTLGPAEDRQNVDIRVVWSRTFTVAGRVTDPDGRPVAGATVTLQVPLERAPERRRTASNASGRFHFLQVVPGDYELSAAQSAETSGMGLLASRAQGLTVAIGDLPDLEVRLLRALTVSGVVVSETGSTPPIGTSGVRLATVAGDPAAATDAPSGDLRQDWTFEVRDVALPIAIRLDNLPEGWFQETVRYRGLDVGRHAIDFIEAGDPSGVTIVISDRSATLAATVVDAAGRPVPNRLIWLYPADADPDEARLIGHPWCRAIFSCLSGEDGRVALRTVPPGDYFAVALDDAVPGRPEENAALAKTHGTLVTLAERERKGIRLRPVWPR